MNRIVAGRSVEQPPQHLQHHVPDQQVVRQHARQDQRVEVERDENTGTEMECGENYEGSRSWSTVASDGTVMSQN